METVRSENCEKVTSLPFNEKKAGHGRTRLRARDAGESEICKTLSIYFLEFGRAASQCAPCRAYELYACTLYHMHPALRPASGSTVSVARKLVARLGRLNRDLGWCYARLWRSAGR